MRGQKLTGTWRTCGNPLLFAFNYQKVACLTTDCSNNVSALCDSWETKVAAPDCSMVWGCSCFRLPQQQTASLKATHLSSLSSTLQLPAKHGIISGHVAHTAQEFNGNLACGAFRLHKIGSREVLQDLPNTFCRGKQPPRGVTVKWASVSMLFGPLARSILHFPLAATWKCAGQTFRSTCGRLQLTGKKPFTGRCVQKLLPGNHHDLIRLGTRNASWLLILAVGNLVSSYAPALTCYTCELSWQCFWLSNLLGVLGVLEAPQIKPMRHLRARFCSEKEDNKGH